MHTLEDLNSLFHSQLETSTLHHAWIIEGADNSQILPIIRDCVSTVLKTTLNESNFHPSLYWLNANASKTVDDVRLAIQFLEKTSWDGGWKVCVIEGADQLNPQGQNALLKVVEEPPEKTLIFLVSNRINTLLPTLYSRGLHFLVSNIDQGLTQQESQFYDDWYESVIQILDHHNYDPLFELQAQLSETEINPQQQGKWVMQGLKILIDAYTNFETKYAHIDRLRSRWTHADCLKRWDAAQRYYAQATEFMIDQKQMCIKLTTTILDK